MVKTAVAALRGTLVVLLTVPCHSSGMRAHLLHVGNSLAAQQNRASVLGVQACTHSSYIDLKSPNMDVYLDFGFLGTPNFVIQSRRGAVGENALAISGSQL